MTSKDLKTKIQSSLKDFNSTWQDEEEFYAFAQSHINLTKQASDGWYCIREKENSEVYY